MITRDIHPLGDHLVITFRAERETTAAGILIPEIAMEIPTEATVVAVGPGARGKSGERVPLEIKAGEHVFVARHAGARVILDDQAYTIIRADDVLAIST